MSETECTPLEEAVFAAVLAAPKGNFCGHAESDHTGPHCIACGCNCFTFDPDAAPALPGERADEEGQA